MEDPADCPQPGVARRTLLGGMLGAAAAGVAGREAAAPSGAAAAALALGPDASEVVVTPVGELVADDVQSALVDVYDRTSALAGLDDLRVAYEVIDDFPPAAGSAQVGGLGWFQAVSGDRAAVTDSQFSEGGVVVLATGVTTTGRSGLHLGLSQYSGMPVFTMEWRLRVDLLATSTEDFTVRFGAVGGSDAAGPATNGPGLSWTYDRAAKGAQWWCRARHGTSVTEVNTGRLVNNQFHRFRTTSDGLGVARFYLDDALVATIDTNTPTKTDRYGQGVTIAKRTGTSSVSASVDWFYLRRELPR